MIQFRTSILNPLTYVVATYIKMLWLSYNGNNGQQQFTELSSSSCLIKMNALKSIWNVSWTWICCGLIVPHVTGLRPHYPYFMLQWYIYLSRLTSWKKQLHFSYMKENNKIQFKLSLYWSQWSPFLTLPIDSRGGGRLTALGSRLDSTRDV
jgi:hypothetical protein